MAKIVRRTFKLSTLSNLARRLVTLEESIGDINNELMQALPPGDGWNACDKLARAIRELDGATGWVNSAIGSMFVDGEGADSVKYNVEEPED